MLVIYAQGHLMPVQYVGYTAQHVCALQFINSVPLGAYKTEHTHCYAMPITHTMHMCRMHTQTPVLCNVQLVDVPVLITSHQLVAMVTKGHSGEMHVLALRGEPSSCVADLNQ